jgi:hypothetical protein
LKGLEGKIAWFVQLWDVQISFNLKLLYLFRLQVKILGRDNPFLPERLVGYLTTRGVG